MKNTCIVFVLALLPFLGHSQAFTEDFESGSGGYASSATECISGADYFSLTNDAGIPATFTGSTGSYFAVQDYDGCVGSSAAQTLTWSGISIAGCTGLSLSIDVAEDDDGSNQDWDANSLLTIEVNIDGGGYVNILQFAAVGGTNTEPAQDTDFDGTGDTPALTDTWQTFTSAIAGTGTSLDLRITFAGLDAGDEDVAIDNIVISGTGCGGAPSNTITTTGATGHPWTVDCTTSDAGTVTFTSTGTFNAPNIYSAQLSDATGSFASPTVIGTLASTANSGTINVTIPVGSTAGTAYRVRVISDDPAVTGSDNGSNLTVNNSTATGTLIMNEISNGGSGTKEYFEMLVVGGVCAEVSIQNLIFDDNNGDWGTNGIAAGHVRFTNNSNWGCVPTGSLIVVYNDGDPNPALPGDDETDSNADKVYVLPVTSSYLETCTTAPISGSTTLYNVGSCTYSTPLSWGALGMSNTADVGQTRDASGNFVHGMGYGSGITAVAGGVDVTGTSGGGNAFIFTNSVDNDYTNASNFTFGAIASNESPGTQNSANNGTYISSFDCPVLPVEMLFFDLSQTEDKVKLTWATASELNSSHYEIERSSNAADFEKIGRVEGAGNSSHASYYEWDDKAPLEGISYYRIRQVDFDGEHDLTSVKTARFGKESFEIVNTSVLNNTFKFDFQNSSGIINYAILSVEGKLITSGYSQENSIILNLLGLEGGIYILSANNGYQSIGKKIFISNP